MVSVDNRQKNSIEAVTEVEEMVMVNLNEVRLDKQNILCPLDEKSSNIRKTSIGWVHFCVLC